MFRNSSTPAIVLRKVRVGEIHKGLTLFIPGKGLISALAHGAFKIKSRFRTPSEPFGYLKVYLYHEPVKDQYKITDMESIDLFEGIRKSLVKSFTASLWAEVIIKSFGGGDGSGSMFKLLLESLRCLNDAPEGREITVSLQFLLRFLSLSGFSPDFSTCSKCAVSLGRDEAGYFSHHNLSFFCSNCARADSELRSSSLILSPGARRYLEKTLSLPLIQAAKVGLDERSLTALKSIIYLFIQGILETGLNTIRCGAGIL